MRAAEYDRAAKHLRAFMDAFDDLFAQLQPMQSVFASSSFPQWTPKSGREAQAEQLAARVTMLAGPAAEALAISGSYLDYKPPGTWQTQVTNPILVWSTMLTDVGRGCLRSEPAINTSMRLKTRALTGPGALSP